MSCESVSYSAVSVVPFEFAVRVTSVCLVTNERLTSYATVRSSCSSRSPSKRTSFRKSLFAL